MPGLAAGFRAGEVVALSRTPRTEVLWFDAAARDEDGRLVADMRRMLRQLTASSPLYAPVAGG